MIRFENVTITYPDTPEPALSTVDLTVAEGELALVVGRTGSGKSTLLGAINGLVPHFTGGRLAGRVTVDGLDTADHPPRELAHLVGMVGQDPLAGFVTEIVEEELAYGMEQLAVPPQTMRKRVEETLDLLGLASLRDRPLRTLSGGQQQRVAIGAVLTAHPKVLVLDEPTSALDPTAAEEVLAAITRLVHDLGITVVLAEHRLERVVQYADRLIYLPGDRAVHSGEPADLLRTASVAPPVVELGRLAGWSPLPLSVRDARRHASPLRDRLADLPAGPVNGATPVAGVVLEEVVPAETLVRARDVRVRYGEVAAVRGVDLDVTAGEVVALMGRNGSGKSSLLWAIQGSGPRQGGKVTVRQPYRRAAGSTATEPATAGHLDPSHPDPIPVDPKLVDPKKVSAGRARQLVGLVPQTPADLLYLDSVAEEAAQADRESEADPGSCLSLLARIVGADQSADASFGAPLGGIDPARHPRELSEGQRLALVLAIQLTAAPDVLLLDEPTRGLDYPAKHRFTALLRELAAAGRAIVVATHDVEFVAGAADRVVVMAEGEVVADGPTADVIVASPAFSPQVAKVLAPQPWLTVDQVAAALTEAGTPA